MDFVTIRTCFDDAEAELLASRLRAEGFNVFLHSETSHVQYPAITAGGIRVQVPEAQAEDARALLDSKDTGESPA